MREIKDQFERELNRHGYGFQYRVLEHIRQLHAKKQSSWVFEAAEFPAEVQGKGTRIDFILKFKETRLFILGECKRINPKFSNWCFIKAPYVRRNRTSESYFVDHVEFDQHDPHNVCRVTGEKLTDWISDDRTYHIGLVVKSQSTKGESGKLENDAIEQAATQVCRGLNGLIELLPKRPRLIKTEAKDSVIYAGVTFLPVIFTTAKLYTCDCKLTSSNLEDGKLNLSGEKLSQKDWIFFQYNISPGIKHSGKPVKISDKFGEILDYDYVRTIPIVAPNGIAKFLAYFESIL
jgi:hypothetical protein